MGKLSIEYLSPADLVRSRRNPRTHSRKQIQQIADSIRTFGFTVPVLIDRSNGIISGHARVDAAKLVGMKGVPCIRVEHLTEAQVRAYAIADNKLASNSTWDEEILATELQFLLDSEINFDVGVIGFSPAEIDC